MSDTVCLCGHRMDDHRGACLFALCGCKGYELEARVTVNADDMAFVDARLREVQARDYQEDGELEALAAHMPRVSCGNESYHDAHVWWPVNRSGERCGSSSYCTGLTENDTLAKIGAELQLIASNMDRSLHTDFARIAALVPASVVASWRRRILALIENTP